MRVLGLDPGSVVTGYGIVESDGASLLHVENGGIRAGSGLSLADRLKVIHGALAEVIVRYRPEVAAVERVFVAKNAMSSLMLGHARGVAILAASEAGLMIAEYSPSEVKQAIVGQGRATKEQIQEMVRAILGLPEPAEEDASDALAVAICHCHGSNLRRRIEEGLAR